MSEHFFGVKDRLAAFYHWDDRQSLEQALMVTKAQKVDLLEINRWSEREGMSGKFEIFMNLLPESPVSEHFFLFFL